MAAVISRLDPPKMPDNPLPPNQTPHPDMMPDEVEKPERTKRKPKEQMG
ncbi:MAG: hypothetical protein GX088_00275 [Clostridia bacterium]|nr:hypothetical protein [Clostridia bacterium]